MMVMIEGSTMDDAGSHSTMNYSTTKEDRSAERWRKPLRNDQVVLVLNQFVRPGASLPFRKHIYLLCVQRGRSIDHWQNVRNRIANNDGDQRSALPP
jgi:hypothetical protein